MEPVEDPSDSDEPGASEGRIPCAWFFLPLPHPLGLPDRLVAQAEVSPYELMRSEVFGALQSSIRILQVERSANIFMTDQLDILTASWEATGLTAEGSPSMSQVDAAIQHAKSSGAAAYITVAEVAVPHVMGIGALDGALDKAIEQVETLQQCVAAVTQRAVQLLTRSHLMPIIYVHLGYLNRSGVPTYDELIEFEVEGASAPSSYGLEPEWLTEEQVEDVGLFADQFASQAAFSAYTDVRREAYVQVSIQGNSRTGVVTLATAGEVFLDTLLLHLLWEEEIDPFVVDSTVGLSGEFAARVAKNLPRRLGGNWDPNGSSPVGRYFQDLVYVRNRVVHTGHRPTRVEMNAALTALVNLEHFVGDRLCVRKIINQYTRTAMAFLARRGIEARRAWTKPVETLVNDPSQPSWMDSFARWRHFVDRSIDSKPAEPGSDPTSVECYAERLPGDSVRWLVHDRKTCYGAEIDPHTAVSPEQVKRMEEALSWVDKPPYKVATPVDRVIAAAWQPDFQLFPELTISPRP